MAQSPDLGDKGADLTLPVEPAAQGAERRGARRVPVRVPILMMVPNGATEETFTRDVSKTGLSFPTTLDISQGDSIEVIVGHGVVAHPMRQRARVARRIPETRGLKALVGAQFTGPQE
ncbi:MAG TPA: PilZ domain-containing protein [Terriglobia bacterium]